MDDLKKQARRADRKKTAGQILNIISRVEKLHTLTGINESSRKEYRQYNNTPAKGRGLKRI